MKPGFGSAKGRDWRIRERMVLGVLEELWGNVERR